MVPNTLADYTLCWQYYLITRFLHRPNSATHLPSFHYLTSYHFALLLSDQLDPTAQQTANLWKDIQTLKRVGRDEAIHKSDF